MRNGRDDRAAALAAATVAATLMLGGCATVGVVAPVAPAAPAAPAAPVAAAPAVSYTHGASGERTPQYFRCVTQAALPMAQAPASPATIARHAAGRCEALRMEIVAALEVENEGKPAAQQYAAIFGDALQARVIHHVAGLVREARQK